jgi:acyl-CoA thioester hydrolase
MSHPAPLPAPLYQGSVNTWECDDGGHLNVRFHFERAMIGIAHMAHALELPRAFSSRGGSTLRIREAHVRFLKEARPGEPLVMHGGVSKLEESGATLCLDMRHADGAPSSCFNVKVAHVDTRNFRPFAWSQRSRDAAKRLQVNLAAHAKPRSIDLDRAPNAEASLPRAIELEARRIGGTMVTPDQCDSFGRLRGDQFVGRVSDSVPNFLHQWRKEAGEANNGAAPAGAVVEARFVYRRFPRPGDLIEVFTGISEVGEKTLRLTHWLCDPATGDAWASMEAVALTFDTATRKTISPSPEARARLSKLTIPMAV